MSRFETLDSEVENSFRSTHAKKHFLKYLQVLGFIR